MGEAKRKKLKLENGNFQCIFCGGLKPATTIDHVPPKIIFSNRAWPEGFEFPACEACNNGTSDNDVVVGLMARMARDDENIVGLLKNIRSQRPDFIHKMLDISNVEARKAAKRFNLEKPAGMTYKELGVVNVTDAMDDSVRILASKLTKAVYYKLTNQIFPSNGGLLFNWFTNAQRYEYGKIYVLDGLSQFNYSSEVLKRNSKCLRDQFDYRYSLSDEGTIHLLQVVFGAAFGFVTIFSPDLSVIQSVNANTIECAEYKEPIFTFIS